MNQNSSHVILHSVTLFLCSIIILNQAVIIRKSIFNQKILHALEISQIKTEKSFESIVLQSDAIRKRINEITVKLAPYQTKET